MVDGIKQLKEEMALAFDTGNHDYAWYLVQSGASPNWHHNYVSFLMFMVQGGRVDLIEALIQDGANVNEVIGNDTALSIALKNGQLECAQALFKRGAKWDILGIPMLVRAVQGQNLACVDLCIKTGVPHFIPNRNGNVALQAAVDTNQPAILRKLLDYGADKEFRYKKRSTPLHVAARNGFLECVKILIEAGADLNVRNVYKDTPLDNALYYKKNDCVDALLAAGAKVNTQHEALKKYSTSA